MFDRKPLYEQVYEALSSRIAHGEWQPGTTLPNEFQLSADLRVSIGTVRKAIELLVTNGVVDRRQGKGTFIVDQSRADTKRFYDSIRNSDGSFVDWGYVSHSVHIRTSTPEEERRFIVPNNSNIACITRTRSIGSRPAMLATTLIPSARFRDLSDLTDPAPIIVSLARKSDIVLGKTEEAVDVCLASVQSAAALKIDEQTPLIRIRRIVRDRDGVPIEMSCAEFHLQGEEYRAPIADRRTYGLRSDATLASYCPK